MTQYARPESVYSNSGWSAYGAATIPEAIDEEVASDSDYTYTTSDGTYLGVALSEVTDPEGNTNHTLRWRYRSIRNSTPPEKGSGFLYCGATLIATFIDNAALPTSWTTDAYTLLTTEADAITDYSDLRVRFTADTIGSSEEMQVSWVAFECPDAPSEPTGGPSNLMLLGVG